MLKLALTFLPPLLIILYVIFSDKFKEPISLIFLTFIFGCLLIIPAGFWNTILIGENDNYSFLAGFTEETLKFFVLFFYVRNQKEFDEPMDAIVYGTLISLGFATLENFHYVYFLEFEISSLSIAFIRAISAIPLHACCGILMGYYFIYFHFRKNKIFLFYSLIIPISIHAFYNFLTNIGGLYFIIYVVGLIIFTIQCHNKVSIQQKFTNS
tara:strand:- start:338 stop:970 length:633 start_codon:yes stop_codon:yes gene_type:complete